VAVVLAAVAAPVGAHEGRMPPMMVGGSKPSPKTLALEKKADQILAQYKKKPNARLKLQAAQAEYEYGHARMFDNALSPREKYRPALFAFRQALKLNPNLKPARDEKEAIEKVYKQMGMPIPQ
jgi:tetratricopeptide (TPR) repeat protein